MAYTKKTWKNSETRLSAENLNTIENGLEAAATKADEAAATAAANTTTINGHTTAINGLTTSLNGLTTTVNNNKTNADSKFTSVENRIAAVEQVNNTQNGTINTLGTEITRVENKFDSSVATITANHSSLSSAFTSHASNTNNPHQVTAAQTGAFSKTEINTLLSPCIKESISTNGSTALATTSGLDLSTGKQNVIITPIKAVTALNTEQEYNEGPNAMWYLTELLSGNEVNTEELSSFSSLLSNCSYDIINIAEDGSTICEANNYPVNYISDMQYVDPTYIATSNGWALPTAGISTAFTYGAFVTIIMYSPLQRKYFLIPTGFNSGTYERLRFYFLDNRYLLIHGNCVYKYSIDLARYGNDIEFFSLGFNGLNNTYTTATFKPTEAHCASFILTDPSGNSTIPTTYVTTSAQEYVFNINPSSSEYTLGFQGYGQQYSASLRMQYARNDSANLIRLGKNIPTNQEELDKDLDIKVKRALSDLISTGTGDPNASTPGLLYFKYLP